MQSIILIARASLTVALCSAGWSLANEANADTLSPVAQGVAAVSVGQVAIGQEVVNPIAVGQVPVASVEPVVVSGFGRPMEGDQLADYRGGFDVVNNDMQLKGAVANNSATNIASGNNVIANGSFANMNGLPMVVQNSGSNVLIQNATIINLQLK